MRVQTEEWRRFIPGVRMYKGKKTLFWNGEPLWDEANQKWLDDSEERRSWEVIIVLPGVEVIPEWTFYHCVNVKTIIMSDSVRRVEREAVSYCTGLSYVKLSRNLEYIGDCAFGCCNTLPSIYIPPSCRVIDDWAFTRCAKLIILRVSQQTRLGRSVIADTALLKASPFTRHYFDNSGDMNTWIKDRHHTDEDNEFSLHRACSSYNPLDEVIFNIVKRQGLKAFKKQDSVGVTASQYLSENPYTETEEHKIIKRYILDMMSEVI
ncbi:hypothetical protein CTEN210_01107 [Chaetoceros tenuissimus]|uniref:Leucine-rich repeat domain-containing protein n=1 Tax=Chaetoceros tenuissimus TaxID=426638 RepID=A0AAD3CF07_9STRA|nr:hypothetical protein CTEN210_01107 [Chaetoceros tenuissimus]